MWLHQTVSINLKLNEMFALFPEGDTFISKIYRVYPEVIIDTFMPVELVAPYVSFDKPMI